MQLSTTGDVVRERVGLQHVEAIKWIAFALMLLEHTSAFAFGTMPHWVMAIGRSVFPMFALALAIGVGQASERQRWAIVRRIAIAGAIAAAVAPLAREVESLNVLFTLALGLGVNTAINSHMRLRWLWIVLMLVAGAACEYGVLGVLAVHLMCSFGREQYGTRAVGNVVAATALICLANGNVYALAWPLVVFSIVASDVQLPRVKRVFYAGYIAQWPAIAAVAWLVGGRS